MSGPVGPSRPLRDHRPCACVPPEAFYQTIDAFNLSDQHRILVLVMADFAPMVSAGCTSDHEFNINGEAE